MIVIKIIMLLLFAYWGFSAIQSRRKGDKQEAIYYMLWAILMYIAAT